MKSCKAFLIGDLHYQKNTVPEDLDNVPRIVNMAKESDPDFIVILGDSLDDHEKVDVQASNVLYTLIKQLKSIARVFVIVGNHDYINNKQFLTTNHHLNFYKEWKRVVVVDKPLIKKIKGKSFVFCPYVEPGRFREALDTLLSSGQVWELADAIFCHQEIRGVKLDGKQKVSTKGDVWSGKFPPIFSGHVHTPQIFKKVHYPGSSKQVNFGELEDKFLWSVEFSEVDPIITKFKINDTSKLLVKRGVGDLEGLEEGKDTKLVISGTSEELVLFKKTKQKDLEAKGYKIQFEKENNTHENFEAFKNVVGFSFLSDFESSLKKEGGYVYDAYLNVFGKVN